MKKTPWLAAIRTWRRRSAGRGHSQEGPHQCGGGDLRIEALRQRQHLVEPALSHDKDGGRTRSEL